MFGIYFGLSLLLKYIWEKLLVSRTIEINTTKLISLFVVCDSKNNDKALNNIFAGDFQLYDIKGSGFYLEYTF